MMSIVDPAQIYHRILGEPNAHPPVVLLHGLMGFSANWGKIWPNLITERQVLVLDQRGHGRSPKPAHGYGPENYAADLLGLLDLLGWGRCHIVGHSMGGRVALRFANEHPERTLSLTMEDSGTEPNPGRLRWIRDLLAGIPTPFPDRESAKIFFTERFQGDALTASFLHANLESREDGTMDWRFHAAGMIETVESGRATDAMAEFASLLCPTLIVRGGKSVEFPAGEAERMTSSRGGVQLVTIPGAGHFVHAEKPKEFSAALNEFLSAVDAAAVAR
jgi:esterase